jgi:hypothetical protein
MTPSIFKNLTGVNATIRLGNIVKGCHTILDGFDTLLASLRAYILFINKGYYDYRWSKCEIVT